MPPYFHRRLTPPSRSFFLLGPRGTGKSTWLRERFPEAHWFNLLQDREWSRLSRAPGLFRQELEALPPGTWVVVDEVQRLPRLLNEVHDLLSVAPQQLRFALTGSSARKLKGQEVNLLAGRAVSRRFHPLVASEAGADVPLDDLLRWGGLPGIRAEEDLTVRADLLEAYRDTYLAQEIRNEGLVRNLDSFQRFLEVATLMHGQVMNIANLARDAGVGRTTVQGFFEVLVDTLVGHLLPAWRPRARVRETSSPKFYWFDPGVVRTLQGRAGQSLHDLERGPLLEGWVLHELRAAMHDLGLGGELTYWRLPSGVEVDFIWQRGETRVGIEVKASERWRSQDGAGLAALHEAVGLTNQVVVYLGEQRLQDGPRSVLPWREFLGELEAGRILPAP